MSVDDPEERKVSGMRSGRLARLVVGGVLGASLVAGGVAIGVTHPDRPASAAGPAAATSNAPGGSATPAAEGTSAGSPPAASARTTSAPAAPGVLRVPALHHLTPPDVVVTLRKAAPPRAVTRLRHRPGVRHVAVLDRGTVALPSGKLRVVGVPVSGIRGFTPSLTARSTPLWQSIARGDMTVAFANSKPLHAAFGRTVIGRGGHGIRRPVRIGAFATLGVPWAQAMVDTAASRALGLPRSRMLLVQAPKVSLAALRARVRRIFGRPEKVVVTRAVPVDQSVSSSYAQQVIPANYLDLYRRAATTCPGLPWTVLAGIGTVETGNGTNVHTSSKGAEGPMQFIPSTWAMYGYDANGDGKADIQDPTDAVFSAARYLCAAGAGRGGQSLDDAIFAYNHAWWYVREVVNLANSYA